MLDGAASWAAASLSTSKRAAPQGRIEALAAAHSAGMAEEAAVVCMRPVRHLSDTCQGVH